MPPDLLADLPGRLGRLLGQRLDFGSDDRKSASGIACAGRLDRGIQRQQVGLPRDRADQLDDIVDLGRGPGEIGEPPHLRPALLGGDAILAHLGFRFGLSFFRGLHLESLDGAGDIAGLILPAEAGKNDVELPLRQFQHRSGQPLHRLADASRGEEIKDDAAEYAEATKNDGNRDTLGEVALRLRSLDFGSLPVGFRERVGDFDQFCAEACASSINDFASAVSSAPFLPRNVLSLKFLSLFSATAAFRLRALACRSGSIVLAINPSPSRTRTRR